MVKMVNKRIYYVVAFVFIMALILGGIIFYQKKNRGLEVVFLDVGQGDAILISQGGNQLLIDGGINGKILSEKLGKYIPFWDRNIEAVIATHPDQDHIGGLIDALRSYKVDKIIKTKAESESQAYKILAEEMKVESHARNAFGIADAGGAEIVEAVKGVALKFSNGAEVEILYPLVSVPDLSEKNSNAGSVVAKLSFGENKFLFAGDLPSEYEPALMGGADVKADILKVAHHGSKYSTSEAFLEKVAPKEAIISAGRNNRYGHPAPEIIEQLLKNKIKIFRTDQQGDIAYKCNPPAGGQNGKCQVIF